MARISGVELKDNWRIVYALTHIKGLGWSLSREVLEKSGVDFDKIVSDLSKDEVGKITSALDGYALEGDLVRKIKGNIQRLQVTNSYRGSRHQKGLPSRGQRTKSNARTKRGKRRTVGSYKKEALAKLQHK